jgi:hypothetical protein
MVMIDLNGLYLFARGLGLDVRPVEHSQESIEGTGSMSFFASLWPWRQPELGYAAGVSFSRFRHPGQGLSRGAVLTALEGDPGDDLAAALARMGRALAGRDIGGLPGVSV